MNTYSKFDFFEELKSHYPKLTKSSRKICDYLFENAAKAQYLSISSLAKECQVAEATIFRFCKALGFDGYNDLKIALAKACTSYGSTQYYTTYGEATPDENFDHLCDRLCAANIDALNQTRFLIDPDSVNLAVNILCEAKRVYCFGQGGSMIMAMEAWARFLTVSDKFYAIQDNHLQTMVSSLMKPQDAIIFVSYSGSTRDMVDILKPAKACGAHIILITREKESPAAKLADAVLLCGANEGPFQSGSISAKISSLFLIDVLVSEYCRRNLTQSIENREATTKALSSRHL
ncbi:MAG: MurR/RpiR family transcriptional regulator [Lachnospiraceae bacterium]|nr:MurR/RpiR family transcriptional regulator [Lachnospiraceae bacterium]